jgi:hypothetical protein
MWEVSMEGSHTANGDYFEQFNVDMCKREYLVIWSDKNTVHRIINCSSIITASQSFLFTECSTHGNCRHCVYYMTFCWQDWWVSVLYKKLVGLGVLNVVGDDIKETSCLGKRGHVRLYCHCARQRGALTLFGVNLMNRGSQVVVTGLPTSDAVSAYVLTAKILRSR